MVALLQLPLLAGLLYLVWAGLLDPLSALGLLVFASAASAYVVRRHLSGLEALRIQV